MTPATRIIYRPLSGTAWATELELTATHRVILLPVGFIYSPPPFVLSRYGVSEQDVPKLMVKCTYKSRTINHKFESGGFCFFINCGE